MSTHEPAPCPSCKTVLSDSTCVSKEGASPSPGDLSVCFYCGELLQFDDETAPRLLTFDKFQLLPYKDRMELLFVQKTVRREHGRK
jgi:hypothetical protein